MPKRVTEETANSVYIAARISVPEKEALDFLVSERDSKLRAQGITGQDTISAWLRGTIRTLAAEAGRPVQDAPPAPAPPGRKARKAARKAK